MEKMGQSDLLSRYKNNERDFRGADLSGADLRGAILRGADLSGAILSEADLSGATLRGADLSGADLRGADLREADLSGADLREADLRGAILSEADLRGADLSRATLRRADLSDADLSGAKGLLDPIEWIGERFECDDTGVIVFKTFKSQYSPPEEWKIEAGAILTEVVNPCPVSECACGINVATLDWVRRYNGRGNAIWKGRIRFEWLIGAVVPYNTDGKFRTARLELLELVDEK